MADYEVTPEFVGMVYRFNRRSESTNDTEQWFQYSADLMSWSEIDLLDGLAPEVTIEDLGGEMEKVEVMINSAGDVDGKIFSRLKVQ